MTKSYLKLPQLGMTMAFAIVVLVFASLSPVFLTVDNFVNIANQTAIISVLAFGMTLVMLSGGIDLSVGSIVSLSAVICALMLGADIATPFAIGAALLTGIGLGATSGLISVRWGIQQAVSGLIQRLAVKTAGAEQHITALSGGNQQKVLLARWLLCHPRVLLLDEPTVGIDIGARSEIHALMSDLSGEGIGILLVSSELPEVLTLSDRVLVMHDGALAGALDRAEASEERVMQLIHAHNLPTSGQERSPVSV